MTSRNSQARLSPAARLDVTDPASIEALIGANPAADGGLDGSLSSAGQAPQPARARDVLLAMKYEVPAMPETGGGAIPRERLEALDEKARREVAAHVPLGRLGRVDEVAQTVAWPLSEQASFPTGATMPVDGGRLAGGA